MWIKHIKMKVNLELCLVGGYTFQQYFRLYDELPTWFIIEKKDIYKELRFAQEKAKKKGLSPTFVTKR